MQKKNITIAEINSKIYYIKNYLGMFGSTMTQRSKREWKRDLRHYQAMLKDAS
jgi:hypothetical protein